MGRMQGKIGLYGIVAALCAGIVAFVEITPATQAQENKAVEHKDVVREVLPYPVSFVRERILTQFDSEARSYYEDYNRAIYALPEKVLSYKDLSPAAYEQFMALPMVKPEKFYVFYGAYAVKQKRLREITPLSVIGINNPALIKYAALSQEARKNDIYLWSPDVPYWLSEYELKGKKLPFRSYFIVHLSPAGDETTTVEIIQDNPVVRMEGKNSLDAQGTVHDHELRPVAPTTRERELLIFCVKQFIEQQVPTRNTFNCKSGK